MSQVAPAKICDPHELSTTSNASVAVAVSIASATALPFERTNVCVRGAELSRIVPNEPTPSGVTAASGGGGGAGAAGHVRVIVPPAATLVSIVD